VAQVHVRAWQAGYRNLLPDESLDGLRAEDRAARYDFATRDAGRPSTLVALDGDMICRFATVAPAAQGDRRATANSVGFTFCRSDGAPVLAQPWWERLASGYCCLGTGRLCYGC